MLLCVCVCMCVCVHAHMCTRSVLFASSWMVAHQAPLPKEFPRQEYWSGLPFSIPGDLPNPRIKPVSHALAGGFFNTAPQGRFSSRLQIATFLPCPLMVERKKELSGLSDVSSSVQFSSVTQSCPTLCDPMDCSLPGSSVQGISQARILEWVAISSSRGSSQPRDQIQVSCIRR